MRRRFLVLSLRAVTGLIIASGLTGSRSVLLADGPKVCELAITGMTCAGCEAAVRIAAKRHAGVRDVTVSYAKGTAVVTYDAHRTTPEAIARAITKGSGFLARPR